MGKKKEREKWVICVFCFHLKLDSDQNVFKFSPDEAFSSLVSLERFPLSPLEETTAPGGRGANTQMSDTPFEGIALTFEQTNSVAFSCVACAKS